MNFLYCVWLSSCVLTCPQSCELLWWIIKAFSFPYFYNLERKCDFVTSSINRWHLCYPLNIGSFKICFGQSDSSKHEAKADLTIVCALSLLSGCLWDSDTMWASPDKPAGEHTWERPHLSQPSQTRRQKSASPSYHPLADSRCMSNGA